MRKYQRNKITNKDISEAYYEWWERYADWDYEWLDSHEWYLEEESKKIGYTISHNIDKEVFQKNMRNNPRFNNIKIISYGIVDMESFYTTQKLRDKKIGVLLGDIEDLSNTIENILKEKQNGKT